MTRWAPPVCRLRPGGRVDLGPFVRAEDGGRPKWGTRAGLAWEEDRLVVRFECEDADAWGELAVRDAPLWTEEVVELFVAPGEADPRRYFELELSPKGVVFDAIVNSPHGDRRDLAVDSSWDCPGLRSSVESIGRGQTWRAEISIPWASLGAPPPPRWRLNLYRIERPRDGEPPEYSAWSPTLVRPADFHLPARFGHLELAV